MPHLGLRDVPEEFESGGDFPEKIIAKCISCSRTQGRASCAALLLLPGHCRNLLFGRRLDDMYQFHRQRGIQIITFRAAVTMSTIIFARALQTAPPLRYSWRNFRHIDIAEMEIAVHFGQTKGPPRW